MTNLKNLQLSGEGHLSRVNLSYVLPEVRTKPAQKGQILHFILLREKDSFDAACQASWSETAENRVEKMNVKMSVILTD